MHDACPFFVTDGECRESVKRKQGESLMKELFEIAGTDLRVKIPSDLDHPVSDQIRKESDRIMESIYIRRMIFDFSETVFMDSSGIGLVMGRYRLIREWNGSVEIHNPAPSIKKVMRLAGLDRIASIHSSPPKSGTNSTKTEAKI